MDSFSCKKRFDDGVVTLRGRQNGGRGFVDNQEYGAALTTESLSYAPGSISGATYLTIEELNVRLWEVRGGALPCYLTTKTPPVRSRSSPTRRSVAARVCFPIRQSRFRRCLASVMSHVSSCITPTGRRLRSSEAGSPTRMADSHCPPDFFGHRIQGLSRRTLLGHQVPLKRRKRLTPV